MPFIKSLISKYSAYYSKLVVIIISYSKIILSCSYYIKKGLIYIIIIALFSCQPFSYFKYIKLNIYSFYNI